MEPWMHVLVILGTAVLFSHWELLSFPELRISLNEESYWWR